VSKRLNAGINICFELDAPIPISGGAGHALSQATTIGHKRLGYGGNPLLPGLWARALSARRSQRYVAY
jgi:hypothetical protein